LPAAHSPKWAYQPSYLPAGLSIKVALGTPVTKSEFFSDIVEKPAKERCPVERNRPRIVSRHLALGIGR